MKSTKAVKSKRLAKKPVRIRHSAGAPKKATLKNIRHTINQAALEASTSTEVGNLADTLLETGIDLLGRVAGFDPDQAQIVIADGATGQLLAAIDRYMAATNRSFNDVASMLIAKLGPTPDYLSENKWN